MVPLVCTSDALSPKQSKSRIGKPGVNSSVLCAVELFPERGAPFFEQKNPRYPYPLDHQQCDCPRPHLKTFQCSQNLLLPALGQTRAATKPPFLAQPRFSAESVSCPCTLLLGCPLCNPRPRATPLSRRDRPLPAATLPLVFLLSLSLPHSAAAWSWEGSTLPSILLQPKLIKARF